MFDLPARPDSYGVNQPLTGADKLRTVAWFYEPNLAWPLPSPLVNDVARFDFEAQGDPDYLYRFPYDVPEKRRIQLDSSVDDGYPWTVPIRGTEVPPSGDPNYYYQQQKRRMYVAVYWEGTPWGFELILVRWP